MEVSSTLDNLYIQGALNILQDLGGFDGVRCLLLEEGHAVLVFDASCAMRNPAGDLHGGFYMAVSDMAAGMAAYACGKKPVTLQCNFNFCKGIQINGQCVTVDAHVVRDGRTVQVVEVEVRDEEDTVCLTATFTMYVKGIVTQGNILPDRDASLRIVKKHFERAGRSAI